MIAYKAWKHTLIVKNLNPSDPWRKTFTERHVLMCSNPRIPFQRMSFYTYCTMHAFFLTRWLCFEQRKITPMSNCSLSLAAGQRLLHDTWRWCTISSALLFLPVFLAVAEPSCFNATMMVISGCLSKRLSTRADGRVLNQFASWTCVSSVENSPLQICCEFGVCEIIVSGGGGIISGINLHVIAPAAIQYCDAEEKP